MYNRLTNNGNIRDVLDSQGRMRTPELDARDNVRDGNGKMKIVKREDIELYGSGIDTSQNVYNRLTNNGEIWSIPGSHLDEGRIKVPDLDAVDNDMDGKIRILKRKDMKVGRTKVS